MDAQERSLKGGVEVVVATPGRLMDHMRYPYTTFERVEVLVLDEADRMLDMGFIPDVKRILRALPPKERRQTLFLSATIPPPVAELSKEMLTDPVRVDIERPPIAAEGISHTVFPVGEDRKGDLFYELYRRRRFETVLAFTRTKDRAERMSRFLKRKGVPCTSIHGDRTQEERTKALLDFRTGKLPVLVATDIAARGLDVENIGHVVNIDLPRDLDDYIHRVGRTARAGATGDAFTFVTPKEERKLDSIERRLKVKFVREVLEEFAGTPGEDSSREHMRSHKRPRHRLKKPI
jgi:ATP-dependent RNA helicase RhlE